MRCISESDYLSVRERSIQAIGSSYWNNLNSHCQWRQTIAFSLEVNGLNHSESIHSGQNILHVLPFIVTTHTVGLISGRQPFSRITGAGVSRHFSLDFNCTINKRPPFAICAMTTPRRHGHWFRFEAQVKQGCSAIMTCVCMHRLYDTCLSEELLIFIVTPSLEFLGPLLRGFCPTAGVSHMFLQHVVGPSV